MIRTIRLTVYFVLCLAAVNCSPVGTCPSTDPLSYTVHLPDSVDCTVFYKCDHGNPVLFNCPSGLDFNPKLWVCDWPQNAGCSSGGGNGGGDGGNPSTSSPPATQTPCPAVGVCPVYDSSDDIVKHLPHATDCSLFCRCVHGVPTTESCPAGLWFNPRLEVCDWPQNSGCVSQNGTSTSAPTQTPTPSSPTAEPTSPTTAPSSPSAGPTTATPLCPAIGACPVYDSSDDVVKHLPHATNCSLYCRCDHGIPITMPCAPGTWFNPILEVCDWPQNSGCISGGSSTSGSSTSTSEPSNPTSESTTTTSSSSNPPTVGPVCPAIGTCPIYDSSDDIVKHLPHATNCSLFCRCVHGIPTTESCPVGLWFNPQLEVCDWPQNSGCASQNGTSTSGPTQTPTPSSPTAEPTSPTTAPSSPSAGPTTATPLCPAIGACPVYDSSDDVVKHLPHATNCSLYCRCDHGIPITMPCAPGTWFNPILEVCDWPQNSGCISGGSSTPGSSTPTSEPSNPTSESTTTTSSSTNPPTVAPVCPAIGTCPIYDSSDDIVKHLPHATNCSLFCRCVHGVPTTESCPVGLWFNPRLEVCDWPQNSGCAAQNGTSTSGPTQTPTPSSPTAEPTSPTTAPSSPSAGPTTATPLCPAIGACPVYDSSDDVVKHLPHATNCSLYCRCDHGIPITMPCAPGTWFNPVLEVCDWPQNSGCISGGPTTSQTSSPSTNPSTNTSPPGGNCDAVGVCPVYDQNSDVVHLPSRTDCTVYCRCDHGVPIKMPCPDGLYFNPKLQVCDYPQTAGCTAINNVNP